jgi:hypothetical protein
MSTTEIIQGQPVRCAFAQMLYVSRGKSAPEIVRPEKWDSPYLITANPPVAGDLVTLYRKWDRDSDTYKGTFRVLSRQWVYAPTVDNEGYEMPEGSPADPVLYFLVEAAHELAEVGSDENPWFTLLEDLDA